MALAIEALAALVEADAGVGAIAGDRIYPETWPQGATFPLIVYQMIDREGVVTQDGPAGLAYPRFQVTSIADSYLTAHRLADALRLLLDGYAGTVGGVVIQRIEFADQGDGGEDVGRTDKHEVRQDYIIWHEEAV